MSRVLLAFLILIVSSAFSFAQATGSVAGTVTVNESVLHGAEVHILQLKRAVQTDDSGNYRARRYSTGSLHHPCT